MKKLLKILLGVLILSPFFALADTTFYAPTPYFVQGTNPQDLQVSVVAGDIVQITAQVRCTSSCGNSPQAVLKLRQTTYAASTTIGTLAVTNNSNLPQEAAFTYSQTATTSETWIFETVDTVSGDFNNHRMLVQKYTSTTITGGGGTCGLSTSSPCYQSVDFFGFWIFFAIWLWISVFGLALYLIRRTT